MTKFSPLKGLGVCGLNWTLYNAWTRDTSNGNLKINKLTETSDRKRTQIQHREHVSLKRNQTRWLQLQSQASQTRNLQKSTGSVANAELSEKNE